MTGRRTSAIRLAVQTALDGQALTGLSHLTVTLAKADDPLTPLTPGATIECVDGAFTALVRSVTGAASVAQSSGGTTQRIWQHTVTVRWAVSVQGCDGAKLDTDLYGPIDAVIDLLDALFEPATGVNYNVSQSSFVPPVRQGDFLLYEVTYVLREPWARS